MVISRREFVKLISFATAGLFFEIPLPVSARFRSHKEKTLEDERPRIRVIGMGGAGCRAVDHMVKMGLNDVEFIVADTDGFALQLSQCPSKILLGKSLNTGLCCGAGLETGYACTLESRETIRQYLKDSDVVLIVAGMGGGTGTGGAPVIARISGELGAWTIGAVTMPLSFEAKRRSKNAQKGLNKLKEAADITVLIPNNAIQHLVPPCATLVDAFNKLDEVLSCVVKTFSNILLTPRMLSPAFTDIKRTFSQLGLSSIGVGTTAENGLRGAVQKAIHSPLLEGISLKKARAIILLTGDETMGEIQEAFDLLERQLHEDAELIWDTVIEQREKAQVTLIASGFAYGDVEL